MRVRDRFTVLMTADAGGSVLSFSLSLSRVLCRAGVRVHLATMGSELRRDLAEARSIEGLTLHPSDFDLEWMDDPWDDVERAGEWLLALEKRCEPSIVHLDGFVHGKLPFRAPVVSVGHSCVCSRWRAVYGEEAPSFWNRYREEVRCGLAKVAVVVAPSFAMLRELDRYYGPFHEGRIIPDGIELETTVVEKEPFFFASGRMADESKNLSLLDRVAPDLPWPVMIAGESSPLQNSRALGELSRAEMRRWLHRAPVLIHPALYEPFGLVPLEAAAAGAALLLADLPSLREIWGSAALYFSTRDEAELLDLSRLLAHEPRMRMELARRAWLRSRRHSIERTAAAYLELYRELLRARREEVQRS